MTDRASRSARLAHARLYVCTPVRRDLGQFAAALFDAGVGVIQLRDKHAEAKALLAACDDLHAAAGGTDGLVAVNDRADIALAAGADILHLGQDDLPLDWARRIVGPECLLGRSTHDPGQARAALAEGWDYFAVGPVYETATKPGRRAVGTKLITTVARLRPPVPWFAIGGIDAGTLDEVIDAGARRAVVVRAVTEAADPGAAAGALRARLDRVADR